MSRRPQRTNDIFDFILLKQAYAGDASRSCIQARCGILQRDATESNYWDLGLTGFAQRSEPGRHGSASAAFSEHRGEHGKIDSFGFGVSHVFM